MAMLDEMEVDLRYLRMRLAKAEDREQHWKAISPGRQPPTRPVRAERTKSLPAMGAVKGG